MVKGLRVESGATLLGPAGVTPGVVAAVDSSVLNMPGLEETDRVAVLFEEVPAGAISEGRASDRVCCLTSPCFTVGL